jgi:hypothetical protein
MALYTWKMPDVWLLEKKLNLYTKTYHYTFDIRVSMATLLTKLKSDTSKLLMSFKKSFVKTII